MCKTDYGGGGGGGGKNVPKIDYVISERPLIVVAFPIESNMTTLMDSVI